MKLQLKTKRVIDYLPKQALAGEFPLSNYKSVTQVLSDPRQAAWFKTQMKDKNSPMAKATRLGTKTHKALESGESKDFFISACLNTFAKEILVDLEEVWGQEEWLAHPLGYKGRFDGVGIFRGKLTLFDHKKTNKPKTKSGLSGYFKQLAAYKQAHEYLYSAFPIEQLAIFNIYGTQIESLGASVSILSAEETATCITQFNERLV